MGLCGSHLFENQGRRERKKREGERMKNVKKEGGYRRDKRRPPGGKEKESRQTTRRTHGGRERNPPEGRGLLGGAPVLLTCAL